MSRQRDAQGQVGPQGLVDRVDAEADIGGDEAAAGEEREREAGRDHPLGPLAVHDHLRVVRRQADDVRLADDFLLVGGHGAVGSRCSATAVDPSRRGEGGGVPITRCGAAGTPEPSVPSVSSMSLMIASTPSPTVLDHAASR